MEYLDQAIRDAKSDDPFAAVTVVVPSHYSGVQLRRELASHAGLGGAGLTGIVNIRFATIEEVVRESGSIQLRQQGLATTTRPVENEAIRSLATKSDAVGAEISALASDPSSLRKLHEVLRELDWPSSPDDDALATPHVQAPPPTRSANLDAFAALLEELRGKLRANGLVTQGEQYRYALTSPPIDVGAIVVVEMSGNKSRRFSSLLKTISGSDSFRSVSLGRSSDLSSSVLSCSDSDEEVRNVVSRVLENAASGKGLWEQAIFYPSGNRYPRIITQQLDAAGIKFNGPAGSVSCDRTRIGRALLTLLELSDSAMRRDEVVDWVNSATVLDPTTGVVVDGEQLDRISASAGVVSGAAQWHERLSHWADNASGSTERKAARQIEGFIATLAADLRPPQTQNWKTLTAWASDCYAKYLDPDALPAEQKNPDDAVAEGDAVTRLLSELEYLDRVSSGVDLQTFMRTLSDVMAERDVEDRRGNKYGSGVFVAPVEQAAGLRFQHVFLLGAADAILGDSGSRYPLLSDPERQSLGMETAADSADDLLEVLHNATGAAISELTVTWPRCERSSGKIHSPSRWLGEILREDTEIHDLPSFSETILRSQPASVADLDLARLLQANAAGLDSVDTAVVRTRTSLNLAFEALKARESPRFTRFDGNVGFGSVAKAASDAAVSATRLEIFASCPRRYLFEKVLGMEPRTVPEEIERIDPRDRGTLVHSVLEEYVNRRIAGQPASLESLLAIAEDHFGEAEAQGITGSPLLWRLDKVSTRQELRTYFAEDTLEPVAAETHFGKFRQSTDVSGSEEQSAPLTISLPGNRTINFNGTIDRIDRDTDGQIVVSDYKTGRQDELKKLTKDPLAGGTKLQLPLYALAAADRFESHGRVRARYWLLSADRSAPSYSLDLTPQITEHLAGVVGLIAQAIDEGVFPGVPGQFVNDNWENCKRCPFDSICPSSRSDQWAQKRSDFSVTPVALLSEGYVPPSVQNAVKAGPVVVESSN